MTAVLDSELHLIEICLPISAFVKVVARGRHSTNTAECVYSVSDMRKALSRDTEKKSIIPLPHPVRPEDIE